MHLKSSFDTRIYFDGANQLVDALRKEIIGIESIVCFIQVFSYVHKNINRMLSDDIPNNWSIISLKSDCNFKSTKCVYFRISSLTNLSGFFIKRSLIPLILEKLTHTDIMTAINDTICDKLAYAFYEPLIYVFDITSELESCYPTDIKFYNYVDSNMVLGKCKETLDGTINYIKQNNISIRHQLHSLNKYVHSKDIIEILDWKIGLSPHFVTELINIASIDISYDQVESYIKSYVHDTPKQFNPSQYVNKDIINKFFDYYIYGELPMCLVIPSFNNIKWYERNLDSVIKQKYQNYRVIYIDDRSTDGTYDAVHKYVSSNKMWERTTLVRQLEHNYQACGRFIAYLMTDDDEIICNLDGDDWLYDKEDQYQFMALSYVEEAYLRGAWSTYGCFYKSSGPQWLEPTTQYDENIIENKTYRISKYLCKHLRTGYAGLYKSINLTDLIDSNNKFITMSTDIFTQYLKL